MSRPVVGLVVAHATLAAGLADAARQVAGADEDTLKAISNQGMSPEALLDAIESAMGPDPTVVFTDLGSGSCAFAARKLARGRPETAVVCGVNLPILIDFIFHRNLPLSDLVERLVAKGRDGIVGAYAEEAAHADRSTPR
jgi:mannose/fructose-specific phosphotransferase system component IIA